MTKQFKVDKIRNILFDLGGVLLNLDYNLTEGAFIDLGLRNFNEIYNQHRQSGLFREYEKGLIPTMDFISEVQGAFDQDISSNAIKDAWNAMLLDFPVDRVRMLKQLSNQYDLFLVSNTNEIHFEAFNEIYSSSFDSAFSSLFQKDYYSHLMGMRKPDAEIFEFILQENEMEPSETLFIDDTIEHVAAAQKLGLMAILLEGREVGDLLSGIGILT